MARSGRPAVDTTGRARGTPSATAGMPSRRVGQPMHVHHDSSSAALVRRQLWEDLLRAGVPAPVVEEAVLVASELVGNAVRHTPSPGSDLIEVSWGVDGSGIMLGVTDTGAGVPRTRKPGPRSPSGRGMQIVDALCDGWGVTPRRDGKQVWAHVPFAAPGPVQQV
ncbi:MAG: ATP-binding protein [Jatrophihabitans sp.]|nr:MAG: ATP-binding protein [Jatrophihabitans sp.]